MTRWDAEALVGLEAFDALVKSRGEVAVLRQNMEEATSQIREIRRYSLDHPHAMTVHHMMDLERRRIMDALDEVDEEEEFEEHVNVAMYPLNTIARWVTNARTLLEMLASSLGIGEEDEYEDEVCALDASVAARLVEA